MSIRTAGAYCHSHHSCHEAGEIDIPESFDENVSIFQQDAPQLDCSPGRNVGTPILTIGGNCIAKKPQLLAIKLAIGHLTVGVDGVIMNRWPERLFTSKVKILGWRMLRTLN